MLNKPQQWAGVVAAEILLCAGLLNIPLSVINGKNWFGGIIPVVQGLSLVGLPIADISYLSIMLKKGIKNKKRLRSTITSDWLEKYNEIPVYLFANLQEYQLTDLESQSQISNEELGLFDNTHCLSYDSITLLLNSSKNKT
jgi:hypothetical protein